MSEANQAQAVLDMLAGFKHCPLCGSRLLYNGKQDPMYGCPNQRCEICCLDKHGRPMGCSKFDRNDWSTPGLVE